jgi:hypothetical protein
MLMPFAFQQSGTVVFDPASISGLTHRYSASGAASGLSGSSVTSWTDAVSGVNMVQSTAGRQPIYIASSYNFNGQPVVRFSSGQVLASTSLSSVFGSANRTVFVIAKTNAIGDVTYGDNLFATDDAPIASYNSNTWPYYLPKAISTRGIHGWASASTFYGEQPVSKPITIVWRQNSGTTTFRREQTTLINAAFSVSGNQGYCVAGKGMQNTGHDSDCDISEILVYNRALSDAEITQVENYAIAKYNLGSYGTLPVTGAALWLDASRMDTLFTDNLLTTAATTDNGPVGGWKDLSGNNRHALQTGTNRPTWRTPINGLNGLGAMSFNGSSQWMDIASFPSLATGYTFYAVLKQPSTIGVAFSSPGTGVAGASGMLWADPHPTTGSLILTQWGARISQIVTTGSVVGYIGNYDGSHTTGNYFLRTSQGTANTTGAMTQSTGTPQAGTAMVGRAATSYYFNSSLYELVVLPRQSNSTEDQAWKTYTAAKWGITWS